MKLKPDTDLAQVRKYLEHLLEKNEGSAALIVVMELLSTLRQKNNELERRNHKLLSQQYRKKSEGVSTAQLKLSLWKISD